MISGSKEHSYEVGFLFFLRCQEVSFIKEESCGLTHKLYSNKIF